MIKKYIEAKARLNIEIRIHGFTEAADRLSEEVYSLHNQLSPDERAEANRIMERALNKGRAN